MWWLRQVRVDANTLMPTLLGDLRRICSPCGHSLMGSRNCPLHLYQCFPHPCCSLVQPFCDEFFTLHHVLSFHPVRCRNSGMWPEGSISPCAESSDPTINGIVQESRVLHWLDRINCANQLAISFLGSTCSGWSDLTVDFLCSCAMLAPESGNKFIYVQIRLSSISRVMAAAMEESCFSTFGKNNRLVIRVEHNDSPSHLIAPNKEQSLWQRAQELKVAQTIAQKRSTSIFYPWNIEFIKDVQIVTQMKLLKKTVSLQYVLKTWRLPLPLQPPGESHQMAQGPIQTDTKLMQLSKQIVCSKWKQLLSMRVSTEVAICNQIYNFCTNWNKAIVLHAKANKIDMYHIVNILWNQNVCKKTLWNLQKWRKRSFPFFIILFFLLVSDSLVWRTGVPSTDVQPLICHLHMMYHQWHLYWCSTDVSPPPTPRFATLHWHSPCAAVLRDAICASAISYHISTGHQISWPNCTVYALFFSSLTFLYTPPEKRRPQCI